MTCRRGSTFAGAVRRQEAERASQELFIPRLTREDQAGRQPPTADLGPHRERTWFHEIEQLLAWGRLQGAVPSEATKPKRDGATDRKKAERNKPHACRPPKQLAGLPSRSRRKPNGDPWEVHSDGTGRQEAIYIQEHRESHARPSRTSVTRQTTRQRYTSLDRQAERASHGWPQSDAGLVTPTASDRHACEPHKQPTRPQCHHGSDVARGKRQKAPTHEASGLFD